MTTTISLPDDVVDELDAMLPDDDRTRAEQFEEVVLPALAGDHVEIVQETDADVAAIHDRLDELEAHIDEVPTLTASKTVKDLQSTLQ